MIIQVDPKTRIKGTASCWELQQIRVRKGEPTWEAFKWFMSFEHALGEAVHREIRLHPAISLSDALRAVSEVIQRFNQLIPSDYELRQKVIDSDR